MKLVRTQAVMLVVLAALVASPGAAAYGWPVSPFRAQHPVRGNFGDPRTVFHHGILDADGLGGTGAFSFHNGIDISAEPGTPVYPVESGTVTARGSAVVVKSLRGRVFQYAHVDPLVFPNQRVTAHRTVLGYVQGPAAHIHLAEIRYGRVVNPLAYGSLAPYRDTTRPQVTEILVRGSTGQTLRATNVTGSISLTAAAYDVPSLPAPGSWSGLPVTPALVTWSMQSLTGNVVVWERVVVDFRQTLPLNRDFWRVYARGTYQNKPRFGNKQYLSTSGRYEFLLTPTLMDTRRLRDGLYSVTVEAEDVRGNRGSRTETFAVCNTDPNGCS